MNKEKQKELNKQCKKKKKYATSYDAWSFAAFYFVYYGGTKIYNVYPCNRGNGNPHFHLTSNTNLGDMSHIPPEYRELFETVAQDTGGDYFWKHLRRFIGVI
jgi:hypothetical protein